MSERRSTDVIRRDEVPFREARPLMPPVYESTTFLFDNAAALRAFNEGRSTGYLYSRYGNPTVVAVERTLARLDGAESALLVASGMAATAAILLAHTRPGDEVVCGAAIYGGTLHLLTDFLATLGIEARFVDLEALTDPDRLFTARTRVVWFESPVNPTLRCVDIQAVADLCRARGVLSVLDNTFASPVNQQPLALGVDLAMQSATKYLNGHSDVTAGVVCGPASLVAPIERLRRLLGPTLDPRAAAALGRSLKTLALRVARQNATAQAIAEWLARDPRVSQVCYPGLPAHPDRAIVARQMTGAGGMVCFDVGGSLARAESVYDRLTLITRAASLGGVESIVSLPVLTSHWGHSDAQLHAAGITPGMVRLSVGLEDAADLIADLDQALG
jgi:cystathionine beta-lyase/cystathionine gamma-synthase